MGQSVILAEALTKQCGLDCAAQQGEPLSYLRCGSDQRVEYPV